MKKPGTYTHPCNMALYGFAIIVLISCLAAIVQVLERERPAEQRSKELEYLPKGSHLRLASLGYRHLVADLVWIKVVQHFGEHNPTPSGYRWAYHAVDVVTDLDPEFVMAYQAAGTVLGVWAGQVRNSIAILEKGMNHNPSVWRLPFLVGYDYFYELCEPTRAAEYFRKASLLPGSPEYLPALAARMTVEGGDPEAALEFLMRFHEQTRDERIREALRKRMTEVQVERDIRYLEDATRRYKVQYGKTPINLDDLISGGIIDHIPRAPFESGYVLNSANGTVSNSGLRERLKVYRHTACH